MPDSFVHKTERPWPNRRLKIAAIVGHTTPQTSRIWFRTGRLGKYCVLYFDRENEKALEWFNQYKTRTHLDEATVKESAEAGVSFKDVNQVDWDSDTTFVVDLENLGEAVFYRYALYSAHEGRIILGHDRDYGFRTPSSNGNDFSFALYSCHMPFKADKLFSKNTKILNMDMWEYFHATLTRHHRDKKKNMDFVIAGGDQAYVDGVKTLNIWKQLNKVMRKENGNLLPDKETMLSWFRDIYRGYWGFDVVRRVFSSFPTYMIWDDHELGDGWGSYFLTDNDKDELNEVLPALQDRGLERADGLELIKRMKGAGYQAYEEYEHSHNPQTSKGQYDYSFIHRQCAAFYVLDGRGHRDINRPSYKILGKKQMERFNDYVDGLGNGVKFLFVVSAVPVLHMRASLVNQADNPMMDRLDLEDDLRDAWEWKGHEKEREELMNILFKAADKGIRVCILSGDVHVSAAFRLTDSKQNRIYQLTSSAITYNLARPLAWILAAGVPDDGETEEGHGFERLALYTSPSYALIKVNPEKGNAVFQLYGAQSVEASDKLKAKGGISADDEVQPLSHSVAKIELNW